MTHSITITDNAYKRLTELKSSKGNPKLMLRIAVDGGGCSGFMYNFELTESSENDDIIFEKEENRIIIDPMSLELIAGSEFDYIQELGSAYFSISNPKATAKCGCGNSFAI